MEGAEKSELFGGKKMEGTGPQKVSVVLGATTSAGARTFYSGLARFLAEEGFSVAVVSPGDEDERHFWGAVQHVRWIKARMVRDPSPVVDMRSLIELTRILRHERPSLTVWGSPKISLLGLFASRLLGIRSIYVIHGLRYEGARGISRYLLQQVEKLCVSASTRTVAVGREVRAAAIADGVAKDRKVTVLANGSANSFPPPVVDLDARHSLRLPPGDAVFGFIGRITADKGIRDLFAAWRAAECSGASGARLLIVGDVEADLLGTPLIAEIEKCESVRMLGHLDDLTSVYSAIDVLVLPSYREGLPTVVLEAASYGVPAIVTDSTGTSEPVLHRHTGLVVPVGNVDAISGAMCELAGDKRRCLEYGEAARRHVFREYGPEVVYPAWSGFISQVAG